MSATDLQYRSSCHCQAVVLDFIADERLEDRKFVLCNCSICNKNGYINYYVRRGSISFIKGEDNLREYSFPPHNRKHMFCPTCGTSMLIISNEKIPDNGKIGINMRTVEGLDVVQLKTRFVNGRERRPEDEMEAWKAEKRERSRGDT